MQVKLVEAKEGVVYHAGPFWIGRELRRAVLPHEDATVGFNPKQRARRRRRSKVARASRRRNRR